MKKNLMGFAALTLILSSCSKNEVIDNVNQSQQTPIIFAPITGTVTTKALEVDETKLQSIPNIPLYAYKTVNSTTEAYFSEGLNFSGKWNTNSQRFFPETGELTFYSFFGSIDNGTTSSSVPVAEFFYSDIDKTAPTISYTIADNADEQADVMAAQLSMTTPTPGNADKTVVLPFKHILSQINFGVRGYTGATIQISNIKISAGLSNTNTYNLTAEAWETPSGAADTYEYMTTEYHQTNGNDGEITYIFGDGGNTAAGNTNISYINKANSNSLILMPQMIFGMTFTFDYEIRDLAGVVVASKTDATAPLFNNAVVSWDPNLRYVYIIDFTPWLDDRKLDFEVDIISNPWENYDYTPIPYDKGNGIVTIPAGMTAFSGTLSENITWDFEDRFNSWSKGSIYRMDFVGVTFGGRTITIKFNDTDVTVTSTTPENATISDGEVVVTGPTNLIFSKQ